MVEWLNVINVFQNLLWLVCAFALKTVSLLQVWQKIMAAYHLVHDLNHLTATRLASAPSPVFVLEYETTFTFTFAVIL